MGILRDIRRSLGFSVDEVAAAAGWSRQRQRQLERSDDPESFEADRLADLLGVDVEAALASGSPPDHPVAALLRAQASTLDAASRFRIAEAMSVARTIRHLQRELGDAPVWERIWEFRHSSDYSHPKHGAPEALADLVRRKLSLGEGPLRSVRDEALRPLGVLVLWDELPGHIDAFSFATEDCGAVFVGNVAGPHMGTAFGRRVTWAHELCHVLFDRPQMRDMRRFCSVTRPKRKPRRRDEDICYAVERRARAFAAYFLAPRDDLVHAWAKSAGSDRPRRVRAMMDRYGLGYEAVRSHLDNLDLLPFRARVDRVPTEAPPSLEEADPWPAPVLAQRSLGVSTLRSGVAFDTVARALREGLVSDEGARELLRVGVHDWETVWHMLSGAPERTWRTSASRVSNWL